MPVPSIRPQHVPAQRIVGLVQRLSGARVHGDADALVSGITHDSRQVRAGDVYVARAGQHTHGIDHAPQALARGATAVLTDARPAATATEAGAPVVVEVDDPQSAAGPAAAWVYGDPALELTMVGITGTNGKTTTAYLADAGLRAAGRRTGLIGTIETRIGDEVLPSARTTPESTDLQALLALMREREVAAVAMEVSSHALALGRVAGTTYTVAVFTNLAQDLLDFHTDMHDYFEAKARLFTPALASRGVVCVDDEWGQRLARVATVPVTTVGAVTAGRASADWTRVDERIEGGGGRCSLIDPSGERHDLAVALPGRFNLSNAASAYVALVTAGIEPAAARTGIAALAAVPGRMERVDEGQPFLAVVDYAHTPDAVTTSWWSPARVTSRGRSTPAARCRSTTGWSCATRCAATAMPRGSRDSPRADGGRAGHRRASRRCGCAVDARHRACRHRLAARRAWLAVRVPARRARRRSRLRCSGSGGGGGGVAGNSRPWLPFCRR